MKIQTSFSKSHETGTLYLVPTPIGNLSDMSQRAIETLKKVDLIASEDTRNTGILLKHYAISTRQVSFHEHNATKKIPEFVHRLEQGDTIAQVSDAGMPSISDPGHDLVVACIEKEIPVISLPGPSAGITAVIASGLVPQPHIFYGFLPRKTKAKETFLESKKAYSETQIFYESPYRLTETLASMLRIYGDRQVVLVRELTKIHEEYQRGTISELLAHLHQIPAKGECLLIVSGAKQVADIPQDDPLEMVENLIAGGKKPSQAIKEVANIYGLVKQELYQIYHKK